MESVFIRLFNVSVSAIWLVLAVCAARLFLRRAPKWTRLLLWALVALRLLVPFSIESPLSLIPSADTIPADITETAAPQIHTGISPINSTVNPIIGGDTQEKAATYNGDGDISPQKDLITEPKSDAGAAHTVISTACAVWLCGIAATFIYAAVSYVRLRYRVREAVDEGGGVWSCDGVSSPFILGIFRPRIILPSSLGEREREMALAHERAHLGRFDHVWKPLGFLLLSLNWYNPAIWIAFVLLCRDIEFACDERVIRTLGEEAKTPYSLALIDASVSRASISACPLAFGEKDVKERVKNVLNYKKTAFWVIIAAVAVCAALAVFFLTDPISKKDADEGGADQNSSWAKEIDFSGETLISASGYRLSAEDESWTDKCTYDGLVSSWIGPSGDSGTFYLTISESKLTPDYQKVYAEETKAQVVYDGNNVILLGPGSGAGDTDDPENRVYTINGFSGGSGFFIVADGSRKAYENVIYAEAFGIEHSAITFIPAGGDAAAERDSNYIDPGYPTLRIYNSGTYRDLEISVKEGRIVLTENGEAIGPLPRPENGDESAPEGNEVFDGKEIWYCEQQILRSVYNDRATLSLDPESARWGLSLGVLSSYAGFGEYRTEGDDLILYDPDCGYTYTFRKENGALVFDEKRSKGPTYGALSDGSVLRRDLYLDPIYSFYDTQSFDINGDGVSDRCSIGMGSTSGLFSFTVTATDENGAYICGSSFITGHLAELKFGEKDGKRVINAVTFDGETKTFFLKASGSVIVLTDENGKEIEKR